MTEPNALAQSGALALIIPADVSQRAYVTRLPRDGKQWMTEAVRITDEAYLRALEPTRPDDMEIFVDGFEEAADNPRATDFLADLLADAEDVHIVRGNVVIGGAMEWFPEGDGVGQSGGSLDVPHDVVAAFNTNIEKVRVVQPPFVEVDVDTLPF